MSGVDSEAGAAQASRVEGLRGGNRTSVHQLIRAQAARTPEATALVWDGGALTFGELEGRASRLANLLRRRGVRAGGLVGFCLERGPDAVVTMLAALKAGAAWVPLDPAYPSERLAYMLADSRVRTLVTRRRLLSALPAGGVDVLVLDDADGALLAESAGDPGIDPGPEALAYVIYTSGSTGRPKGVGVTHRGLRNTALAFGRMLEVGAGSRVLQFAPLGFDASVFEVFVALIAGAELHLAPREALLPGPGLLDLLEGRGITHALFPPSALAVLPEAELPALGTLIVGGEACTPELVRRWAPGRRFVNAYGPTEVAIAATAAVCAADGRTPPIGPPIAGAAARVLDAALRPVAEGELYVGGEGVARGYLGRPALTAERFVPDPFAAEPGARMHRTRDRVRVRADGALEFVGRMDEQVKVRGHRVEPGEVADALAAHPALAQAAVVARTDGPGGARLVAYAVAREGAAFPAAGELRAFLGRTLPEPMIPSAFVTLDALPLTSNGKVDRGALPAPPATRPALARPYVPPRTEAERRVAAAWAEVLGIEEIGADDGFLELGGHSLAATQVVARLRQAHGMVVPMNVILGGATVARTAAAAKTAEGRAAAGIRPVPRGGDLPVSFSQERVWFLSQLAPGNRSYHTQAAFVFRGALDVGALEAALSAVVVRHEIYRTTFPTVDSGPVQRIQPPWEVRLPVVDLTGVAAGERDGAAQAWMREEFAGPFDLSRLPLVRWTLLRVGDGEHRLVQVEHHVVHDGWSFNVFLRELLALYGAFAAGRPSPLPEPVLQFGDYTHYQRRWLQGDEARRQLDFWRERLAGSTTVLALPLDRPRPEEQRFRGAAPRYELPAELYGRLRAASRRGGVTLFATMLAAFDVLLSRWSGQTDLNVGTGIANRRLGETQGLIGMFVNSVVVRTRLDDDPPFAALARRVHGELIAASEHQELPFEAVVEALRPDRSLGYNPLFQACFSFHDSPIPELTVPGLEVEVVPGLSNGSAKFDINVIAIPRAEQRIGQGGAGEEDGITLIWEYSSDLFDPATIDRMAAQYRALLDAVAAEPETPVSRLPLAPRDVGAADAHPPSDDHAPGIRAAGDHAEPAAARFVPDPFPPVPVPRMVRTGDRAPATDAAAASAAAPREVMEARVAAVWREVLRIPAVGADESFFDVGGTSLLMYRLFARLGEQKPGLRMVDLFRHPTVAGLAAFLAADAPVESHESGNRIQVIARNDGRSGGAPGVDAPPRTLHQHFERQARLTPDAVALVVEEQSVSYRALNERANRLAHHLRRRGVGPEVRVGVCLERGAELVAALLAVLKAGGAYVPLDPAYPTDRLRSTLADAGAPVLVTQDSLRGLLPADGAAVVAVDGAAEEIAAESSADPRPPVSPRNLAYLIYTSGSTGTPKGVAIEHESAVAMLEWAWEVYSAGELGGMLASTSTCFDMSVFELFAPLGRGGRVIVVENALALPRSAAADQVRLIDTVPSAIAELVRTGGIPSGVRTVNLGGEPLHGELVDALYAAGVERVYDLYGPSEDTTFSTCALRRAGGPVTIGRPITGSRGQVLDAALRPVADGVEGELYLGGRGVTRGYLGRPGLTAERYLPDPFPAEPGARMYRTGDRVRVRPDGSLEYLGRLDHQVKIRGYRVETGEIEAVLRRHPGVDACAVIAREDEPGEKRLVAYLTGSAAVDALRAHLRQALPEYMVPGAFVALHALPLTPNGKLDRKALPAPEPAAAPLAAPAAAPRDGMEERVAEVWREVLRTSEVGARDNFFDLGGTSLLMYRVFARLREARAGLKVVDLFRYPTVEALAAFLRAGVPVASPASSNGRPAAGAPRLAPPSSTDAPIIAASPAAGAPAAAPASTEAPSPFPAPAAAAGDTARPVRRRAAVRRGRRVRGRERDGDIAVVGMSCRFPGARNVAELWSNLCGGVESITFFSEEELRAAGVAPELLRDPSFVPAFGAVADAFSFDAAFFGVSRREAQAMDPQHRVFLECAWSALEDAACDPARFAGAIGVYAGTRTSAYFTRVQADPELAPLVESRIAEFGNMADCLPTRTSYKLGLRGPSMAVQTACSTSLVAIHLACRGLLGRECDVALAGGSTISPDQVRGYKGQQRGTFSPDGHCRAFDARGDGTVVASGVGVVVLKRLADALRDGDPIRAVVRGSAINNDGAAKVGFTAPGVEGQAAAISRAHAAAGVDPSTIGYVETHGTATALGDPIEIAALTEVFGPGGGVKSCALGAVKTNLGHMDMAAGVAGFIKAVLSLEHRTLVPTLHFQAPNPGTGLDESPFYVNTALREWPANGTPRRAGVSAFGIGGTNAHVVLEEPPARPSAPAKDGARLLVLSAKTEGALGRMRGNLAAHLAKHPELPLAEVAHTLQEGRAAHRHRWAAAARTADEAREALSGGPARPSSARAADRNPPVAFLFPGGGTQYAGMARDLYAREPVFRGEIDGCADALAAELGLDPRTVLFPAPGGEDEAQRRLEQVRCGLPALFAVEYALARLWMSWGVRPEAMLGHSLGEYVAACVAGVFSRESALGLVTARARLIQSLPAGSMLAVPMPERELRPLLPDRLALAAVNSASHCVVSGGGAEIGEMEALLADRGVVARRLHVHHAGHSAAMDPILEAFAAEVRRARPAAPRIPFLSNVTGDWITAEQATDPAYWVRHLRETVRFADGVRRLLERPDRVLLEVGPGETLGTFARRDGGGASRVIARSLPSAGQPDASDATVLDALGALWTAGVEVDWRAVRGGERPRRVPLPTYPFEREEYRVAARTVAASPTASAPAFVQPVRQPERADPAPAPITPAAAESTAAAHLARTAAQVAGIFSGLLGTAAAELDPSRTFLELGADSLLLMQASRGIESTFGVRVPFRELLEGLSTIADLSAHLAREVPAPADLSPAAPASEPATARISAAAVETARESAPRVPEAAALAISASSRGAARPSSASVSMAAPDIVATQTGGSRVQDLVARQLAVLETHAAIMQAQLELLRGGPVPPGGDGGWNGAAADHPAAPPPSANGRPAEGQASVHRGRGSRRRVRARRGRRSVAEAGGSGGSDATVDASAAAAATIDPAGLRVFREPGVVPAADRDAADPEVVPPIVPVPRTGEPLPLSFSQERLWIVDRMDPGNPVYNILTVYRLKGPLDARALERAFGEIVRRHEALRTVFGEVDGVPVQVIVPFRGLQLPVEDIPGMGEAEREAALTRRLDEETARRFDLYAGPLFEPRLLRLCAREHVLLLSAHHTVIDGLSGVVMQRELAALYPAFADGRPSPLPELLVQFADFAVWQRQALQGAALERQLGYWRERLAGAPALLRLPTDHPRPEVGTYRGAAERTVIPDALMRRLGAVGAAEGATLFMVLLAAWKVLLARYGGCDDVVVGSPIAGRTRPEVQELIGYFANTLVLRTDLRGAAGFREVLRRVRETMLGAHEHPDLPMERLVEELRPERSLGHTPLFQVMFLMHRPRRRPVELRGLEMVPVQVASQTSKFDLLLAVAEESGGVTLEYSTDLFERSTILWMLGHLRTLLEQVAADPDLRLSTLQLDLDGARRPHVASETAPASSLRPPVPADPPLSSASSATPAEALPLSFAQERLWRAVRTQPGSALHHIVAAWRLEGALDAPALERALCEVVRRHEAPRTTFREIDGAPAQVIAPFGGFSLPVEDRSGSDEAEVRRIVSDEAERPFDLATGPLFRARLLRLGADDHLLLIAMHPMVGDGWSVDVLFRELAALYAAYRAGAESPLAELPVQYADFAVWEREEMQAGAFDRHLAYWRERLAGAPAPLALPADHPRPAVPSDRGASASIDLPRALLEPLRAVARGEGATPYMLLLAAFQGLLSRYSGSEDVVVGSPVAGRTRGEVEGLIGPFASTLVLRTDLSGDPGFRELLRRVRAVAAGACEHQEVPFGAVLDALGVDRSAAHPALVRVLFAVEDAEPLADLPGLRIARVEPESSATMFDLALTIGISGDGFGARMEYRAELFERGTIVRMLGHLRGVLEQVACDPDVRLSALELEGGIGGGASADQGPAAADHPAERIIHPPVEEQAERIPGTEISGWIDAPTSIVQTDTEGAPPLSFAQERLWFLDRMEPGNPVYNVFSAQRLQGALDVAALERALGEIVRRHQVLRTTFAQAEGRPVQVVAPFRGLVLPVEDRPGADAAELRRLATEEAMAPFDLAAGPPFRARLARLGADDHLLLISIHHIVSDAWSIGVLFGELAALYEAYRAGRESPLPALPVQYGDFARWEREDAQRREVEAQLAFWTERLAGAPALLELPTDHPRPAVQSYRGAHAWMELPLELLDRLRTLARGEGATPYMLLHSAFQLLLARYAGSDDLVVGSPISGRGAPGVEGLIGLFVNTLVLRTDVGGDPRFRELVRRTRDAALDAYGHQDVPFERLVEALRPDRSLSHSPLVQVMFSVDDLDGLLGRLPGLELSGVECEFPTAKFDLSLGFVVGGGRFGVMLEYATDLFERDTAERMLRHLRRVVEQVAEDPDRRISALRLLDDAERRQVVEEWNRTGAEAPDACIHQLFEQQVERTPDAPAVVCEGATLGYRALNERANRLARHLARAGVGPEARVGLCLERGAELVVAMLAVLKAGGAYLPLDPAYPPERLRHMLADSGAAVLVTQESLRDSIAAPAGVRMVSVDGASAEIAAESAENPARSVRPEALAYVIYTSGSTGTPKGVGIEHRSLANYVVHAARAFGLGAGDRVAQSHSVSFDPAAEEVFATLLCGATLVPLRGEALGDPRALWDGCRRESITVLDLPTAVWQSMVPHLEAHPSALPETLRLVVTGGERMLPEPLRAWRRVAAGRVRLLNSYGPTEATVGATLWDAAEAGDAADLIVPIGRPVPNTRCYVLDAAMGPAPVGVPGELYVGGAQVARGYPGRPGLTAERFVPDPFAAAGGGRLYRTGDRARWKADGTLEYLGRVDGQVKVRGFRVETGEIEAALRRHEGVAECAVVAREHAPGDRRLVAYVTRRAAAPAPSFFPSLGEHPLYDELLYRAMAEDEPRVRAYRRALAGCCPGAVVVDVGTGADALLARLAVEAGARRVYAVEVMESSFRAAREKVRELGLEDRIVVLHGDAATLQLPEPVDVCVSELIGNVASSEGAVALLDHARRWLRPAGAMVPLRCETLVAAATLPDPLHADPAFDAAGAHYAEQVFARTGHRDALRLCVRDLPRGALLSASAVFEALDFSRAGEPAWSREVELRIDRAGRLDGLLLWIRLYPGDGEAVDSLEQATNWLPVFFPVFHPGVRVDAGDAIRATCEAIPSDDGVHPDYRVRGVLRRVDGREEPFDFHSPHHARPAEPDALHRRLFDGAGVRTRAAGAAGRVDADALRAHLRRTLPDYMVPAAFVRLDALPLTPGGKVDRRALPAPPAEDGRLLKPGTELEARVAALWRELLGVEGIGVEDNFFDLGGHSLLLVRLQARLESGFGCGMSVVELFQYPTVRALAARLQGRAEAGDVEKGEARGAVRQAGLGRLGARRRQGV